MNLYDQICTDGKIPFWPITMHFAARFSNMTYGDFASDHTKLVEANIKVMNYFGINRVSLISDPYRETSAFGAKILYHDEAVPQCIEKLVKITSDLKKIKSPDVCKAVRTLDRIQAAELFKKQLPDNTSIVGWIEGPLAEACDLCGVSEMLMHLMTDPEFSNPMLDICTETAKNFALAQINAGCNIIGMGDAICSQIDEHTYKDFVKSRHKEIVDFVHQHGAKIKLHVCGDVTHLLNDFKDLELDIIDIDWQVDPSIARQKLGDEIILKGKINPVHFIEKNQDQIKQEVKNLLNLVKGTKFILSGGCEISVQTPVENLMAAKLAIDEFYA